MAIFQSYVSHYQRVMIDHDHWNDYPIHLPIKNMATGPPVGGLLRRRWSLSCSLDPGGWEFFLFEQPENGMREKSSSRIVYSIFCFFFWCCCFLRARTWTIWTSLKPSDHSDQQKMGGIKSAIIWIHRPKQITRKHPEVAMIKPDSSWHLSNLPSWAKKTQGA